MVDSAGTVRDVPLARMSDEQWHAVLDTNLTGSYTVCRAVVAISYGPRATYVTGQVLQVGGGMTG